jgi:hypothetical protein
MFDEDWAALCTVCRKRFYTSGIIKICAQCYITKKCPIVPVDPDKLPKMGKQVYITEVTSENFKKKMEEE